MIEIGKHGKYPILKITDATGLTLSLGLFKCQKILERFDNIVAFIKKFDKYERFCVFNIITKKTKQNSQFVIDFRQAVMIYRYIIEIWQFTCEYCIYVPKYSPVLEEHLNQTIVIDYMEYFNKTFKN